MDEDSYRIGGVRGAAHAIVWRARDSDSAFPRNALDSRRLSFSAHSFSTAMAALFHKSMLRNHFTEARIRLPRRARADTSDDGSDLVASR
ncbi:MAG TPA: hypothetical protein VMV26_01180 [Alphaproteobacteria bacterium]|jgi:hypothetical protein|nr:hypothetical protein [Alphaproteobacteria bacterium]